MGQAVNPFDWGGGVRGCSPFPHTEGTETTPGTLQSCVQPVSLGTICSAPGTTVWDGMTAGSQCFNPNKWVQHPHGQAPMPKIAKTETQVFIFLSVWLVFVGGFFFLLLFFLGGRILFLA